MFTSSALENMVLLGAEMTQLGATVSTLTATSGERPVLLATLRQRVLSLVIALEDETS